MVGEGEGGHLGADLDDPVEDARLAQILSGPMHDRQPIGRNALGGSLTHGGKLGFERHGILLHLALARPLYVSPTAMIR